jgi:photosystem II stability/assembly factor-like uncharacterized protein
LITTTIDSSLVYVAAANSVFVGSDKVWVQLKNPQSQGWISVAINMDGSCVALLSMNELYISYDFGVSWQLSLKTSDINTFRVKGNIIMSGNGKYLYAYLPIAAEAIALYRSQDAGNNWQIIEQSANNISKYINNSALAINYDGQYVAYGGSAFSGLHLSNNS